MRRKFVLILAVPALFMLSIFFLMSDIRNIPDSPSLTNEDTISVGDRATRTAPRKGGIKPPKPMKDRFSQLNPPNLPPGKQVNIHEQVHKSTKGAKEGDVKPFIDDKIINKFSEERIDSGMDITLSSDDNRVDSDNSDINTPTVDGNDNKEKGKADPMQDKTKERQQAVKEAYLHAWRSYERYAFGKDELEPPKHMGKDWLGMGLTIVDSIDTMYLMGLKDDYKKARDWIEKNLSFDDVNRDISVFETTIRVLGGLLTIFELTNDKMFLEKAKELGDRLLPAFDTPAGYAYTTINLKTGHAMNPGWAQSSAILSETGTLQLEFSCLSKHTGDEKYRNKAMKVYNTLHNINKPNGLYPVYLDINSGSFRNDRVTLGALGDSYYEYLLKVWILTGKTENKYREMYDEAMRAVINHLVKSSTPGGLTYIAEKEGNMVVDKMDHLVCFAGAMFALGAYHNVTQDVELHMKLGKEITKTCHEFYIRQKTGLGPEIAKFAPGQDFYAPPGANHYILRPETVESYFVLYWLTRDTRYQDWGWEAFQAIEKHCRTPDGYCGVRDVTQEKVERDDLQQSFFMAETLKYLFLLFSPPTTIDLNDWVFNTEAHPLKVWKNKDKE